MPQANVGDLALLEEAVADDVLSTFLFAPLDQTDHRVDVSKVVPRLRDLGLVGGDDTADLGALLLQSLDSESIGHAALKPKSARSHQPHNWCSCSIMPEQLIAQPPIEAFDVAVLPGAAALDVGRARADRPDPPLH